MTFLADAGTSFQHAANGSLLLAVPVALLAGLVSFASPCVLPLVPGYLSYVTGLVGSGAPLAPVAVPQGGGATAGAGRAAGRRRHGGGGPDGRPALAPRSDGARRGAVRPGLHRRLRHHQHRVRQP